MAPQADALIKAGITGINDVDAGFRRMSSSARNSMSDVVRVFDKGSVAADVFGEAVGAMAGRFLVAGTAFEIARRSFMSFANVDITMRRIGLQAGVTTREIEGLMPQFSALAKIGGDSIRDVAEGFNTFRERAHLSVSEARMLFPEIVKGAYATGVPIKTMGDTLGTIIFNLKLTGDESKRAMDVLYAGVQRGNLSLQEMAGMLPELTATMQDWGETGLHGAANMLGRLNVLREAFGDSGQAAQGLFRIYQSMGDPRIAQALGRTPEGLILELRLMQQQGKNVFEEYIGWIDRAVERGDLRIELLDRRQRLALDTARKNLQRMREAGDDAFRSQGRLNKALAELREGPMDAVNHLISSLEDLAIQIGATFHNTGVTEFITFLSQALGVVNDLLFALRTMRELITGPLLKGPKGIWSPQEWQSFMKGLSSKYLPEAWSKKIEQMEQEALKQGAIQQATPQKQSYGGRAPLFAAPGLALLQKASYYDDMKRFESGGALGVAEGRGYQAPSWMSRAASFLRDRDTVNAMSSLNPLMAPGAIPSAALLKEMPVSAATGLLDWRRRSGIDEKVLDEQRQTNMTLNEILEALRARGGEGDGGGGGGTTFRPGIRGRGGQSLQQYTRPSSAAPLSRGAGGGAVAEGGGGAYPPNEGTLAQQRQRYMAELEADPQLKQLAIGAMASEGGVQSNMEQLFNYANMRGMTIRQALYSGQYGPVTGRNRLSTEELLRRGARQGQKGEAALQKVGAGSNITNYATDQGMAGDPNFAKYMANRDYYNMHKVEGAWFSYHGERGRKWAQRQRQIVAESGGSGVFEKGAQAVPYAAESDAFGQSIMPSTPQDTESTHTIKYRFERDPGETQFRRGTMRQQLSVEARNSLYESATDIGMA